MAHEETCKACGETISGPVKKSVIAALGRHVKKKHPSRAKKS